jgi:hypothetical protein
MREYVRTILPNIQSFSSSLDKKAVFLNHAWCVINANGETEKLIFQKNGTLIMSKDGDVKTGKWEYLSHANSLLIDRGVDKKLYNQGFIDQSVMVLKLDGTTEDFILLVNENLIPDLDLRGYLNKLIAEKNNLIQVTDDNDRTVFVQKLGLTESDMVLIDAKVYSNSLGSPEDGVYRAKNQDISFMVKGAVVIQIYYDEKYNLPEGRSFSIQQQKSNYFKIGDKITHSTWKLEEEEVFTIENQQIIVRNSEIVSCFRKNLFGKWKKSK